MIKISEQSSNLKQEYRILKQFLFQNENFILHVTIFLKSKLKEKLK